MPESLTRRDYADHISCACPASNRNGVRLRVGTTMWDNFAFVGTKPPAAIGIVTVVLSFCFIISPAEPIFGGTTDMRVSYIALSGSKFEV